MNAQSILHSLVTQTPQRTADLPRDERGIYGLIDHAGQLRYIGCTTKIAENFRKRIHQRHRTGSETHSHYFSKIYNTGRMWRDRLTQQGNPDAKIAKDFRSAFIAEYCRAVCVPLTLSEREIVGLETTVIALAPPETTRWNRATSEFYQEPSDLVDLLVRKLALSREMIAAIERQRMIFEARFTRNC
ncbi:GIY-YIG nuclease family protein [Rhizobium leguminosarum]|uniref:GIY-YIG nuclease family protein n=1 Tax=Rhizobium leguminosarum TaxID=384 RepID=UPI001441A863|nr:GIY-YIG nuclease family protein [Rhizobium leguminosarum]MBY5870315.1 GIY-YIG nuclease family protein [Rhizobium leguminosarum]NKM09356.1 hypothetical protein [Rhizobium leguminosarum bv. viciae]